VVGFGPDLLLGEGHVMPIVNVKIIEGVFDAEQKQRIVRDVTDPLIAIEGENLREVTHVLVEEVRR
jgi:4-oxalocrotonate tautomerase